MKNSLKNIVFCQTLLNKNEHAPITLLANSVGLPGLTMNAFAIDEAALAQVAVVDDPELNEIYER